MNDKKNSLRHLLLLSALVAGGVLAGCFAAAEFTHAVLMNVSLGPAWGRLMMLIVFLVMMIGGGMLGGWLANKAKARAADSPDNRETSP